MTFRLYIDLVAVGAGDHPEAPRLENLDTDHPAAR
jgi:hypothetical protein